MTLIVLSLTLAGATRSNAAEGAYEPNDTILSATGPLGSGETRLAALETAGDYDFFYFYVTSPQAAQVELTLSNLGGGKASDIETTIFDSSATPLAGEEFIRDGETRTVTVTLEPQKYFVEVANNEGFGDAYSLSAGGGTGAFGTYAQIAARCERATVARSAAQTGLKRAEARLQRTRARVRGSHYGTPGTRRRAHVANRRAMARIKAEQRTLREASRSQRPWCTIAQ